MSLLVTHTDFDAAPGGSADALAAFFRLQEVRPFGEDAESGLPAIGRVGEFQGTVGTIDAMLADRFGPAGLRVGGDRATEVTSLAVVPGSGSGLIEAAAAAGAQALVTGDVSHHRTVAAGDLGLAVQLHLEPRHAPKLEPFIKEFPKTTVIVDHLGRPFQGTPAEHAVVVRWSRFDNVVMKISSVPDKRTYPHRDVQPLLKELTKAFGPARCIYGGGFAETTTGASYRAHHERIRGLLSHLSRAEQDQILGGNAARLFGFKSKP